MSDAKWSKMSFNVTIDADGPVRNKWIIIVDFNEAWSYWLEKMYPGINPSVSIKKIVYDHIAEFVKAQPQHSIDTKHKDFLKMIDF